MNLFTEEQKPLLYMIGLDVGRMTDEEKEGIRKEVTDGSCLQGDEITLKGCPLMEGQVKQFALRLLKRKGVASSVIDAVRRDPKAILRIRPTPNTYTMTIEYRSATRQEKGQEEKDQEEKDQEEKDQEEKDQEKDQEEKGGNPWSADTYLKSVYFSSGDEAIKKRLMETIGVSLSTMKQEMLDALKPLKEKREDCTPEQKAEWLTCTGGCETAAKRAIQKECGSTAYFIRSLAQSILALEGTPRMEFALSGSPSDLTGQWKDDVGKLRLVSYGAPLGQTGGRLVMGFGPSASGKTFMAQTLLNLLRKVDNSLPPVFLSIDGDIYRSISYTYGMVKHVADAICAQGFDNLVSSGMSSIFGSLFKSKEILGAVLPFLKEQGLPIHLYVPDTLGSCIVGSCESIYKRYKEITGDSRWIGLLIWQHKTGGECTFPPGYRCKGTTESGTARQKKDGKKYSSTAWANSMKNGEAELLKAPGGSYKIHNSGQEGSTTVIMDYSKEISKEKREVFRLAEGQEKTGWRYLVHTDAQEYLEKFRQRADVLKDEVNKLDSHDKDTNTGKGKRVALQRRYEDLLQLTKDPLHRIYRSLYPTQMETSDRAMEKLAERAALFVADATAWEKEHDTIEVKVYYVRHGYSCANAERNTAGPIGKIIKSHTWMSDPPLHPKGIKQAQSLGEDLRGFVEGGGRVDLFFTSQLFRAIQTGLLLRAALPSTQIPLHIVPHLCEVGITRDNLPDKVERITDADRQQMVTNGPVEVDAVWSRLTKSDIQTFVDGSLQTWLLQKIKEAPDQKQFNVFVVAHANLILQTFGKPKLDNGQLLPVTYSFTSAGFLLNTRLPTEEERKEIEIQFPSPYAGTTYTLSPECEGVCDVLKEISAGVDVQQLRKMAECVHVTEMLGDD